jgi:hypothetical protein
MVAQLSAWVLLLALQSPAEVVVVESTTPRIVVLAPLQRGPRNSTKVVLAAQEPLTRALQALIGPRVLNTVQVLEAQTQTGVTTSDLKVVEAGSPNGPAAPAALGRLAQALEASRAVLVEVADKETTVYVFQAVAGVALVLTVPRTKNTPLDDAWAQAVAAVVHRSASTILAADPAPVVVQDAHVDILAEEARERARAQQRQQQRIEDDQAEPFVWVMAGGGAGWRFLDVSGPGSKHLAPTIYGTIPGASIYVALSPLRAIPSLRSHRFLDLSVELAYRRGFPAVTDVATSGCGFDDDDAFVRLGYRALLIDHPWVPRVGVTVTGEIERMQFQCNLPVVSTMFPSLGAGLRLTQPVLPRDGNRGSMLELDLQAGGRAVLLAADEGDASLGVAAEAWLVLRPWSFVALRGGTRFTTASAQFKESAESSIALLTVDDKRLSVDLQLGVVF